MSEMNKGVDGAAKPDARLSRRSLVAAGGIVAALGPAAASKALAVLGPPVTGGDGCTMDANLETGDPSNCMCFLSGTRLLTPIGEAAIETLSIGDLVATESGEARAIRWIGRITVDRDGDAPWHADAMPVRVSKDAFGTNSPSRDLYLSRAHMVHLNGVLIPIGDLING